MREAAASESPGAPVWLVSEFSWWSRGGRADCRYEIKKILARRRRTCYFSRCKFSKTKQKKGRRKAGGRCKPWALWPRSHRRPVKLFFPALWTGGPFDLLFYYCYLLYYDKLGRPSAAAPAPVSNFRTYCDPPVKKSAHPVSHVSFRFPPTWTWYMLEILPSCSTPLNMTVMLMLFCGLCQHYCCWSEAATTRKAAARTLMCPHPNHPNGQLNCLLNDSCVAVAVCVCWQLRRQGAVLMFWILLLKSRCLGCF